MLFLLNPNALLHLHFPRRHSSVFSSQLHAPLTIAKKEKGVSRWQQLTEGSLSSDIFERRTFTGSEPFSLLISLDRSRRHQICIAKCLYAYRDDLHKHFGKRKDAKIPLSIDVRRSKTSFPCSMLMVLLWEIVAMVMMMIMFRRRRRMMMMIIIIIMMMIIVMMMMMMIVTEEKVVTLRVMFVR